MIYDNVEDNYNNGHLPLWMYCQLNGKTPEENYKLQHDIHLQQMEERKREQQADQRRRRQEKELEKEVARQLDKAVEKAL